MKQRTAISLIKKALRSQGQMSDSLNLTIRAAATAWVTYEKAAEEVDGLDSLTYSVLTREGEKKIYRHPALDVLRDQQEILMKYLKLLGFTINDAQPTEGSPLADLINKVNESAKYD
jgi:hypothetical protein